MNAEFADANAVFYLIADCPKADRAEEIQGQGSRTSVQVLNAGAVKCRKNAGFSREDTASFLLARHDRAIFRKTKPLDALELRSTLSLSIWSERCQLGNIQEWHKLGCAKRGSCAIDLYVREA